MKINANKFAAIKYIWNISESSSTYFHISESSSIMFMLKDIHTF